MEKVIDSFSGEYRFLSNFSPHGFYDQDGIFWKTVEHFFQANKADFNDKSTRRKIANASSPSQAKKLGRQVNLRVDWENIKFTIMLEAVEMKFKQNIEIKSKLLQTYPIKLIEGNSWHDNFWGNCTCSKCKDITGNNHLGIILMYLREGFIFNSKERK